MAIPVFSKGQWITYTPPSSGTQLWTPRLTLQVASVYAAFVSKGISTEKSSVLAECYANKQLYGVQYNVQTEEFLKSILV